MKELEKAIQEFCDTADRVIKLIDDINAELREQVKKTNEILSARERAA